MKRYRYDRSGDSFEDDPEGEWVRYEDAQRAIRDSRPFTQRLLDEKDARIRELQEALVEFEQRLANVQATLKAEFRPLAERLVDAAIAEVKPIVGAERAVLDALADVPEQDLLFLQHTVAPPMKRAVIAALALRKLKP